MIAVVILLTVAVLAALLVMGAALLRARTMPGPPLRGRTVVVHTRRPDDQTIRGVMVAEHADRLTLRDAVYVHTSGDQPIGGLIHIPRGGIAFLQELEPTGGD